MSSGQNLPTRWRDDPEAARELRALGEALGSLDEAPRAGARERVWAGLDSERSRPRLRMAWVAAGATAMVALVAVTGAIFYGRDQAVAEVEYVGGDLVTSRDGDAPATARVGQGLPAGTWVATGAGPAVLRLHGVGKAWLSAASESRVGVGAESIELLQGRVIAAIAPRGDKTPFAVRCGEYRIRVLGTVFGVACLESGAVEVRVDKGRVELAGAGVRRVLGAGESFSSTGGPVSPLLAEAQRLLGVERAHVDEPAQAEAGGAEPRASPSSPVASEPVLPSVQAPRAAREPVRESVRESVRASSSRPESTPSSEPTKPSLADAAGAAEGEARTLSEGESYARAMRTGDTAEAIRRLDEVAAMAGPRAEIAAYQAARLSRNRDPAEAIRRFEALLAQHPLGVFAPEARLNLVESALQVGDMQRASENVEAFLALYPASERVPEVRFMRAEILRQRKGDCQTALPDYDAALLAHSRAEDALFFKAWCLLRLDRSEEATLLLEQYLTLYPAGRHAPEARGRVLELEGKKR